MGAPVRLCRLQADSRRQRHRRSDSFDKCPTLDSAHRLAPSADILSNDTPGPILSPVLLAFEVFGFIGAARTSVAGGLWPGTQRARARHTGRGISAVFEFCRDDLFRRRALLHPALHSGINVVRGVVAGHGVLAEIVGPYSAAAMLHARNHEEPDEFGGILHAQFLLNGGVIVQAIDRRNRGVGPAVEYDELTSPRAEL